MDNIVAKCNRIMAGENDFWAKLQKLILENPGCINNRFAFSRICFNLSKTDKDKVEIDHDLLKHLLRYFLDQLENDRLLFNNKDMNNVIGMLVARNVKRVLPDCTNVESLWEIIFDDLVVHKRINLFEGSDLAILCKLISSSGQRKDEFWQAMTDRFINLQSELNLKDFMTICNAFSVAHTVDNAAFVKVADQKLTVQSADLDWHVMSLLFSTLNLIKDEEVL